MTDFFNSLDPTHRFYVYIAIGASIIFIIQTIMTFVGADSDTGMDADFDGNLDADAGAYPFQLFSLRNLINFLLGFGWAGASLYDIIDSNIVLCIVSVIVGGLFILAFFLIMRSLLKLSEDNTFDLSKTVGKTGDVYLTIPPKRSGKGKVFISVNGSTRELDAITDSEEHLKNGALIKIVGIEGDLLIVESLSKK